MSARPCVATLASLAFLLAWYRTLGDEDRETVHDLLRLVLGIALLAAVICFYVALWTWAL